MKLKKKSHKNITKIPKSIGLTSDLGYKIEITLEKITKNMKLNFQSTKILKD
jgi:hypothetical protein